MFDNMNKTASCTYCTPHEICQVFSSITGCLHVGPTIQNASSYNNTETGRFHDLWKPVVLIEVLYMCGLVVKRHYYSYSRCQYKSSSLHYNSSESCLHCCYTCRLHGDGLLVVALSSLECKSSAVNRCTHSLFVNVGKWRRFLKDFEEDVYLRPNPPPHSQILTPFSKEGWHHNNDIIHKY